MDMAILLHDGLCWTTRPLGEHQDCRGGSLRVFRQFVWLGVGSVKVVLSCLTHQRVTQAVSWLRSKSRF
jgi:hypothetical protein